MGDACALSGAVHFHLDLIQQVDDSRPLRLLVEGEDICSATAERGPFVNAAGLLVLAFSQLRGAPPWAGAGLAKAGFERHCGSKDPQTPDRCMGMLSSMAHCTLHPWCSSAKWWLLRHLGADDLAKWKSLPGVWATAALSSGGSAPAAAASPTRPIRAAVVREEELPRAVERASTRVTASMPPADPAPLRPADAAAAPPPPSPETDAVTSIVTGKDKVAVPRAMNFMPPPKPPPLPRQSPPSPPPPPPPPFPEPGSPASEQQPSSANGHSPPSPPEGEKSEEEARQDAAAAAERERCLEKGRRAVADAEPLVEAWLHNDTRPPTSVTDTVLVQLVEGLICNPKAVALWPPLGILLHVRRLPLASTLALRHAIELQPRSTAAYAELGLVSFGQLFSGEQAKMGEMARFAQRSLVTVRSLHPRLEDHIVRQSRGARRLIGLAGPSLHMHVLLSDARARRKDMDNMTHLAPSISAAHRNAPRRRQHDEYGALAQIHHIRRERFKEIEYSALQRHVQEVELKMAAAMHVPDSERPFDYARIEEEMLERVGSPCLRRPMPRDGVYELCLNANATHTNYNFGEFLEDGRTPEYRQRTLGRYATSERGDTRDKSGPLVVQMYEGGEECGTPPHTQPRVVRVHYYCGRRLALQRAEERDKCVFRMNVSLPLLCDDQKARTRPLATAKKSRYHNYDEHTRPKNAWDRLLDGTDQFLTGPVLGPAYYHPLPKVETQAMWDQPSRPVGSNI